MLLLLLPALGCNKFKARAELKHGNALYANEQFKGALAQFQKGLELDPDATFAWRSAGLSALALYKPGDTSAANVKYATTATDAFEKYLVDFPEDEKVREYLLSTYVNAKMYDKAMAYLEEQKRLHPNDSQIVNAQVRLLIQSGDFPKAEQLAQDYNGPKRHELLYTIGFGAWTEAYNNPELDHEHRTQMVDTGLAALERALQAKPDYFEAMVYYNLLYREKAKLETDATKRMEYIAKADEWKEKATVLGKKLNAERKAAEAQESKKS
jgi:tetratricopeptide (TPR) repeat protein